MTAIRPEEIHFRSGEHRLFGKLFAVRHGQPAIVLLHGLGFHSFEYDELAPVLASAGLSCFAFDFRCHGRSEGRRGYWRLADLVQDALAAVSFVNERTDAPVGVFGNSLGALVAVHVAAADARITSVVASGCPTRVADFGATKFRLLLLRVLQLVDLVLPLRVSINWFEPYRTILTSPAIIRRVRDDPLVSDARRFAPSTYANIFAWNALDAAHAVKAPVLVLAARGDRLQPVSQAELLAKALPRTTTVRVLDTDSHVPNLENPELLAPILLEWFSSTGLMAAAPPAA